MTVVADSSPLISLSAIDSLGLLKSLFETVHIPQAVYQEVLVGKGRPGAKQVRQYRWIKRHQVRNKRLVAKLMNAGLDEGESEAIILAQELKASLIILDDERARNFAKNAGLPVTGTLGIALLAKEKQLITSAKELVDGLVKNGLYVAPAAYRDVLRNAGETE